MTASMASTKSPNPKTAAKPGRDLRRVVDGLIETTFYVATDDGQMQTFFVHPEDGGPFPVAFIYMDAVGFRDELRGFARRFARRGYFTVLPNLYYRDGGPSFDPWDPSVLTPWILPLAYELSNANVMRDTAKLLDRVKADSRARGDATVCVGYCMGGRMAIAAAGTFPDTMKAAASLYGGRQVTDEPNSPHLVAQKSAGEFYFAFAGADRHVPDEQRTTIDREFKAVDMNYAIDVFSYAEHGFAFPERHCYNWKAAEETWEKILAMFDRCTNAD
jgi:carboxymethylenebutenolidase